MEEIRQKQKRNLTKKDGAGEKTALQNREGAGVGRGWGERPAVDVIIPTYKPGKRFLSLLKRLEQQTYPVNRILVINTEERYWDAQAYEGIPRLEVTHVTKAEFDHGRTRNLGAEMSRAEVMLFMTDDALPKDRYLVEELVKALFRRGPQGEEVAAAYARQLPARDCSPVERCTRRFNYPEDSWVKTLADLPKRGIKTYFASNVCCAYRKDIFENQGGFVKRTIFNEDMIYAAGVIQEGYGVAYAASAQVIHSHNLTAIQQFHRNFDMAVSQADHPEVFAGIISEGEGIRLVKETAKELIGQGNARWLPSLVWGSGWKYAGYRLGKVYRWLPEPLVRWCSMSPQYWNSSERKRTLSMGKGEDSRGSSAEEDFQEYFDWEEISGRR